MKKINEYIIEKININLTSLDNLQEIIDEYNLEQNLIKANIISDFDLKQIYAEMFHIECFSYELDLKNAILLNDYNLSEKERVLLLKQNNEVLILLDNPFQIKEGLMMLLSYNYNYKIYIATTSELNNQLNYYKVKQNDLLYEKILIPTSSINQTSNLLLEDIDVAPIVQKVNYWINKAIMLRASDIHFEPTQGISRIRIRIDGKLKIMDEISNDIFGEVVSRIKIIANLDISQKLKPQDGKIVYEYDSNKFDLRISTIPTILGEKIVIRILCQNSFDHNFDKLNYTIEEETLIKSELEKNNGLILVTGPTGCGKTTTLYTYLKELIKEENNIVTIEDPVEYSINGINQIQTNSQIGLSFAALLRNILRQDPNIIMVGEIRDEETAQIAMRAAISGHLVLSTLHSNYAVGSITRLLDMGIPKYLVSSALRVVISQQLVRKLCDKCKQRVIIDEKTSIKFNLPSNGDYYESRGCANCYYTGYEGRILLSEIMIVDNTIREMIMNESSEQNIIAYLKKKKMILLNQKLKELIVKGIVSIDEIK